MKNTMFMTTVWNRSFIAVPATGRVRAYAAFTHKHTAKGHRLGAPPC